MAVRYIVTFFIAGTLLAMVFSFFLIYFIVLQRNRRNKYHLDTQSMILEHQAKESKIRLEENERTMSTVAKEIHDNLGQVSNMIRMHLHYLETLLSTKEQFTIMNRLNSLSDNLIEISNDISHSLNGDFILAWGLQSMVSNDLDHIRLSKKMECKLETIGVNKFLNPDKELIIYRIAQEAINNILKHSAATLMRVTINFDPSFFLLKIQDNGIGFIYDQVLKFGGTGLNNMQDRAKSMNGTLDIKAIPNEGCTLILLLRNN